MPVFTREEAARLMRAQGWTDARIAAALAREYGTPNNSSSVNENEIVNAEQNRPAVADDGIERNPYIDEAAEQREIVKLAKAHGFRVRSTSTVRRARIAPGFPDLFLTHRVLQVATFWETKRQVGGALEPAQVDFRDDCRRCDIPWGSGDRYHFAAWLLEMGVAEREDDRVVPAEPWNQMADAIEAAR